MVGDMTSIALIDCKGGSGLPDTEIREARNAEHLLLLTGGSSVKGQLVQIRGGEGSADPGPRTYVFRTTAGDDRNYPPDQIARIYLGMYPFAAAAKQDDIADAKPAYVPAGGIRVPASSSWVATGLTVRQGELVFFDTSGDVQLSDNAADRARPCLTPACCISQSTTTSALTMPASSSWWRDCVASNLFRAERANSVPSPAMLGDTATAGGGRGGIR